MISAQLGAEAPAFAGLTLHHEAELVLDLTDCPVEAQLHLLDAPQVFLAPHLLEGLLGRCLLLLRLSLLLLQEYGVGQVHDLVEVQSPEDVNVLGELVPSGGHVRVAEVTVGERVQRFLIRSLLVHRVQARRLVSSQLLVKPEGRFREV